MSWLSEQILFFLAKRLYRTEIGHTSQMKEALTDWDKYDRYRSEQIDRVTRAAGQWGITFEDKVVLDLGCGDGAITPRYLEHGARRITGVDIDARAIARAQQQYASPRVTYLVNAVDQLPLASASIDLIVCYDVWEHVARPAALLHECHRVLREGAQMLIGTWGWYHPFAPHLWSTMPVPWAHVFFSERTLLRTCRRVYTAPWYVPTMHDVDHTGQKKRDKYLEEAIPLDYLNKLLIRDYERLFQASAFEYAMHPESFGSRWSQWTKPFLSIPWIREFVTGYLWVVLRKPAPAPNRIASYPLASGSATPYQLNGHARKH